MRPCGLSPCAPRYYYSTPRCTLVYSLVLSSVCCASVWCCAPCPVVRPVPCLPCLWCVCVVLCLWCVGVVCPLVLHATTIAHLDVLLCTLLCFLLCAVLLCGAVPPVLWCALCLACPACGVSAWCCVCGVWVRPAPLLSLPLWVCATVRPCTPVLFLSFFLGIIPAPYMGVLYAGLIHSLYTCPIF